MSRVRQEALEALADALTAVVSPDIHHVVVGQADADVEVCFPHLVVASKGAFSFSPMQDDEIYDDPDSLTVEVGAFIGRFEITLGFKNQVQRINLEEKILHLFLSQQDTPGVLTKTLTGFDVGGRVFLGSAPVAFILDSEAWNEEKVFARARYSMLEVLVNLPALVTRTNVYDLEDLVTVLQADVITPPVEAPETIVILDTGIIGPYP